MYPELFHIGGFTMNSFGVMMALAFIIGGVVARWQFKKRDVSPDFIYGVVIAGVIGGLLGAKIHFLILHPELWPSNLLSGSGLVWFGGMFGALLAVVLVTLLSGKRLAAVMDATAIAIAMGYVIGRIGCFLAGDDYGKPTDLPWGVSFPKGIPPTPPGVHVHPTQLYESAASLVIFALLVWVLGPRFRREGPLIFVYAVLGGIERFLVEFIRTNEPVALGLTQQQWISIALVVVGAVGTWWFATRGCLRPAELAKEAAAAGTSGAGVAPEGAGGGRSEHDGPK
jgi:phosphatidylglycerol:prolipoprotein diacylglycerol transferase